MGGDGALGGVDHCFANLSIPGWGPRGGNLGWARSGFPLTPCGNDMGGRALGGADDCFANLPTRA